MEPRWLRLLKEYERKGRLGLTPSFLLGALRSPPGAVFDEERSLDNFRALLESMRDETGGMPKIAVERAGDSRWPPLGR